jgi:hypothetical protein
MPPPKKEEGTTNMDLGKMRNLSNSEARKGKNRK